MSYITILLIAIGLSMDSVAVSISGGICMQPFCLRKSLKIASIMGGFQGGILVLQVPLRDDHPQDRQGEGKA